MTHAIRARRDRASARGRFQRTVSGKGKKKGLNKQTGRTTNRRPRR